jgi:hypothetical protein
MLLLPDYYKNSKVMREILRSARLEIEKLRESVENSALSLFVIKTDRLDEHELDVGITPNANAAFELRRAHVLARLRGIGTATKEMIISIVKAFWDSEIQLSEREFKVALTFVGFNGYPAGFEDIRAAVLEVLPAHLELDFDIHFCRHEELKKFTHAELKAFTHLQIRSLNP